MSSHSLRPKSVRAVSRPTVTRSRPGPKPVTRRLTVEEWIKKYDNNRPVVPGAVDAFIRDRE